jgi:polar amino acid transport system permease protein
MKLVDREGRADGESAESRELPVGVIVKKRPVAQVISTLAILYVGVWALVSVVTNERMRWDVIANYMFAKPILDGLLLTIQLTIISSVVGITLGIVVGLMRLSSVRILRQVGWLYCWIFRGVPLLVQLIFWYNIAALYPTLSIGIPFGPSMGHVNANLVITAWTAAILGLGLHDAAHMAEIVRAGILSVNPGQREAGLVLGLSESQIMSRVILPQAIRIIIPPTGNQVIGILKMTSLVSALALGDLLYSAEAIFARNFQPIPLLMVASLWYLIVVSILMVGQDRLEKRFGRFVNKGRA